MVSSITWLLVRTSPFEVMIIPVPATWPPGDAVSAVMSTIAESSLATVASESAPPLDAGPPPLLLAPPVPVDPPDGDVVEGAEADVVVSAHAVPPPAPTQAIAKTARAVRRNPEPPREGCGAGGQLGGPHCGYDDQGP